MKPPVVLAADQVQRAAVEPRDHELAAVECAVDIGQRHPFGAGAQRQRERREVLRLHRQQMAHDVGGAAPLRIREQL
jgi:hypothetical protein